jgi:hypothetical protein
VAGVLVLSCVFVFAFGRASSAKASSENETLSCNCVTACFVEHITFNHQVLWCMISAVCCMRCLDESCGTFRFNRIVWSCVRHGQRLYVLCIAPRTVGKYCWKFAFILWVCICLGASSRS